MKFKPIAYNRKIKIKNTSALILLPFALGFSKHITHVKPRKQESFKGIVQHPC